MGASQSSTYQPSITGLSKKDGNLVFKKIDDTEESIPIDTVSIQNVVVDSEGNLVITRTDGSKDGPFNIKGKDSMVPGPKGDSIIGPQGEGIKDLTVSEQGFATITTTSDRKFGPFNVKGNTGAIGSQGPSGKDSDLNYAKFETTMKTKSVWCDNGNCVTPGNSTVNGDISGKSIGRNKDDIDWFRIFGTKSGGTALYNGLSMGDGGLRVGDFNRTPNGQIEATGDIISGGQLKSAGTVTAFSGARDLVGELNTLNRGFQSGIQGSNDDPYGSGRVNFGFKFDTVPKVFATPSTSNVDNAYVIQITAVDVSGFNFQRKYMNKDGGKWEIGGGDAFSWFATTR
jgi:hypothetical protein